MMKTIGGTILTYVSKGDGGYLTPADSRRSDALYIAAKRADEQDFTMLNKGKPILYIKWTDSVEDAPHAQMGSPSLFRKPDGTYGLIASENNAGNGIYLWDSEDLLFYRNQRRVEVNADGAAVERPTIVYDETEASYKLYWTSGDGSVSYVSTSCDGLQSFQAPVKQVYPAKALSGSLPDNAVASESAEFEVTEQELERVIRKYAPITNKGIEPIEALTLQAGDKLPALQDRVRLTYSDGSSKQLRIEWDAEDIQSMDTTKRGAYEVKGRVVQSMFDYPYIPERADPFIMYNHDDGYYYATGSYYPESDPAAWTEKEMGKVDYDRVTLRRARTLAELRNAEESDVWVPRGEDGFVPFLWAPEVHKINGKWYILVGARQATSGRSWCSTMVLVEYIGSHDEMLQGGMLKQYNWKPRAIEQSPCSFDMTFAEINGVGYYIWPNHARIHIQQVDPTDPAKLIGQAVQIKSIEWPFEYGKHNVHLTDQGIVEGAAVLQYNGKIYLSYAGATVDKYYCTAIMIADAGADVMDPASWSHPSFAALSTEDVANTDGIAPHCGPGHNSFSIDEAGNPINIYHARPVPEPHTGPGAGGLHDPCRHTMVSPAHVAYDGTLILNMTAEEELSPAYRNIVLTVNVV
ncbi:family 43 glycosylhydrolase [Paenibacillus sp. PR3]|uniref:Family 43 glycosylhydrolase n=1 Tax=Paenibacillus terricola TaxID=2763503 RepID=A0ABR8N0P3_9BACL|nr:family 43 glycosylhydrolase [Paenibacillus terricola]MBD3921758.1 family 43 glycosylhydrolase [Paenibacillus terricola]